MLLSGALDLLEPVVRERLPTRQRTRVDVLRGSAGQWIVDRAQPDARLVGLGPAPAEQVRAAHRTERLRAAVLGLVGAEQILAGEERDLLAADAPVRGADAAGELLAGRAVAERARLEVVGDLELDPTALAAASERHGASVAQAVFGRRPAGIPSADAFLASAAVPRVPADHLGGTTLGASPPRAGGGVRAAVARRRRLAGGGGRLAVRPALRRQRLAVVRVRPAERPLGRRLPARARATARRAAARATPAAPPAAPPAAAGTAEPARVALRRRDDGRRRRQRQLRRPAAGRADELLRRRRHDGAEARGRRHRRPDAEAPGRGRAVRDRLER